MELTAAYVAQGTTRSDYFLLEYILVVSSLPVPLNWHSGITQSSLYTSVNMGFK